MYNKTNCYFGCVTAEVVLSVSETLIGIEKFGTKTLTWHLP